jgi:UDP-3-O-[3-hydroxymyristoyl] glucosamine N-acyltransferase
MMGGQSAIADHVTVGSNVKLAACSALHRDAASNSVLAGTPADDARIAKRQWAAMCRLPEVLAQMSRSAGKKPAAPADSSL